MKTKKMVFATLLITLGLILNIITPGFLGLMKPDFLLAFYLIALCTLDNLQEKVIVVMVCALMSAMTSLMPGAQIANFVEKILTGISITLIYPRAKSLNNGFLAVLIGGLGTLLSGFYFLVVMTQLGFIEGSLLPLFMSVVLPTAFINIIIIRMFLKGLRYKFI